MIEKILGKELLEPVRLLWPRYISGARSTASFRAREAVTVLSVTSTVLEQVSTECQLRFNKVFLRTLIRRLRGASSAPESGTSTLP